MTKNELITEIQKRNTTASTEFLAQFASTDLADYLRRVRGCIADRVAEFGAGSRAAGEAAQHPHWTCPAA